MTAPSIKEALQDCIAFIRGDISGRAQREGILREAEAALATLQPDGERRETITNLVEELIEAARYVEHAHPDYSKREQRDFQAARLALDAAIDDAILASGLVQNEAGIRRDERIFQPIGYTEVGKMIDAGIKAVDLYNIASTDILRRTDIRDFLEAALAIRSSRHGGAET